MSTLVEIAKGVGKGLVSTATCTLATGLSLPSLPTIIPKPGLEERVYNYTTHTLMAGMLASVLIYHR